MNAKTVEEILTVLAAKFGTTAAHLWDVLVRQAYVEGALAVFWVVVSAVAVYIAARGIGREAKKEYSYNDTGLMWASLGILFIVVGGINIDVAVTSLGNPEYAALKLVLGAFSN